MIFKTAKELLKNNAFVVENDNVIINNPEIFKNKTVDRLADTIILGESLHIKRLCYWITYKVSIKYKIFPSSIQELYKARGQGEFNGFTVPAINTRTLTYDLAKAVFRSAKKINAAAFIFEIAKSEIGYTAQRPLEYAALIVLAAIKEGYSGPIFIQGDHFQVKASNYSENKDKEINQLKELIQEAVDAQFYNIDIDSSTLVDLSRETIPEQQKLNYEVCAFFTKFIRQIQPKNMEISIGGEIGEVGGKNSVPQELVAFMKGYLKEIGALTGISKMSIQTGTTHGGVVLPDGSIAKAKIDFNTLRELSQLAQKEYKLAGCVQHGASTLPNEAFSHFPENGCAEIHLATQFQNIVYEYFPIPLKEKIYEWLHKNCANERKPGQTDDQFIYKTRKKALGPFKKEISSLSKDLKNKISAAMEKEFDFMFGKLNIANTREIVEKYVKAVVVQKTKEDFLKEEANLGKLEGAD
ncbi:MAG: class II fructose-bisphosphate aldolase [Candidatus Omnitrophota bacterium]|nr:MAG: class II fructose-bisphosphate aldolase [Candidatus Omnitrophota bacterium]